jgi:signal transduction histidine kinase
MDDDQELPVHLAERLAELERRRRVAEGLGDILRVINSRRPLSDILDYIVTQARQLSAAEVCVLHHVDYVGATVAIEASSGLPAALADIDAFPLYSSAWDRAILARQPVYDEDNRGKISPLAFSDSLDPRVRRWREVMLRNYCAALAVPLVVQDEVYGSLVFYYIQPRRFSAEEIGVAGSLAEQAALAIDNAGLRIRAAEMAAAAERSRLAADLHDAVTQTLFSASLIAEVLPRIWARDPALGAARLAELCELNRGALAEMRTLLLELRPEALAEASLPDLLAQLATAATGRFRLPVALQVDGERQLAPSVQVALYRVAQESLNNVVRHAGAGRAIMSLCLAADGVTLVISDDGVGFDPATKSAHSLGLGIMRERMARLGGELTVTSAPGRGTRVQACCPLPAAP